MSADDRGLALWHAVLDAAQQWPESDDVMGVGTAGNEVVVIRVHCIDPTVFEHVLSPKRMKASGEC